MSTTAAASPAASCATPSARSCRLSAPRAGRWSASSTRKTSSCRASTWPRSPGRRAGSTTPTATASRTTTATTSGSRRPSTGASWPRRTTSAPSGRRWRCTSSWSSTGSSSTSTAGTSRRVAAADIMNLAAANYEAQIGVEFKLEYHVAKGPMTYIGHQYASSNAYALLQEFRTRWESGWLASKRRGAVHLLTGKNIDGSVIGIAYVDVMCDSITGDAWNGEYEYGISKATQSSLGCNVGLVMQELGRNAGSSHYLGCSTTFHPLAIGQIEDHMDGHVPNDGRTDGCWCEKMFNS